MNVYLPSVSCVIIQLPTYMSFVAYSWKKEGPSQVQRYLGVSF